MCVYVRARVFVCVCVYVCCVSVRARVFATSTQACSKKCAKKSPGDLHISWKHVCADVYVTDSFEHARERACMHTVSLVLRGVDGARRRKCCRKKKVVDDVFISNNGQLRVKSNLLCRRRFEADIYYEDVTCSSA